MPAGKKAKAHGKKPGMKRTKKTESGSVNAYISRNNAVKKLQVSLAQFRKLCILKGVFPREVPGRLRQKKRIYYLRKDIAYLAHDPLMKTFREFRVYKRKARRLEVRGETAAMETLRQSKPEYKVAHVVKERFPTFADALREMDEALCMTFLFANHRLSAFVRAKRIAECTRLSREWEAYVAATHCLKKGFLSIKGIYYQVEISGQRITWLAPFPFRLRAQYKEVDYGVMMSFLDFYQTALGFVMFKLYAELGVRYPPMLSAERADRGEELNALLLAATKVKAQEAKKSQQATGALVPKSLLPSAEQAAPKKQTAAQKESEKRLATLGQCLARIDEKEKQAHQAQAQAQQSGEEAMVEVEGADSKSEPATTRLLFTGLKFFLGREVPRRALEFVIRALGGSVSWEGDYAPYAESSPAITHQIVDRDTVRKRFFGREYVQPQWLFDCLNEGILLPTEAYGPNKDLPPHLSPFVNDVRRGYVPERRAELDKLKATLTGVKLPFGADAATAVAASGQLPPDEDEEELASEEDEEDDDGMQEPGDEDLDEQEREDRHQAELEAELEGKSFVEGSAAAAVVARKKAQKREEKREEEARKEKHFSELRAFSTMSFNKRRQYRQLTRKGEIRAKALKRLHARREAVDAKHGKAAPTEDGAKKRKIAH